MHRKNTTHLNTVKNRQNNVKRKQNNTQICKSQMFIHEGKRKSLTLKIKTLRPRLLKYCFGAFVFEHSFTKHVPSWQFQPHTPRPKKINHQKNCVVRETEHYKFSMSLTLPLYANPPAPKIISRTKPSFLCRSSSNNMEQQQSRGSKLKEFPYLLESHKDTMVGLISAVENRLGSHLLPSSVPPDVEYYQNDSGSSQGTLYIRCGIHSSPVRTLSYLPFLFLFLSLSI